MQQEYAKLGGCDNITELLDRLTCKDQLTLTPTQDEALRTRLAELRVYCPRPEDVSVDRFLLEHHRQGHPHYSVTAQYCVDNNIKYLTSLKYSAGPAL